MSLTRRAQHTAMAGSLTSPFGPDRAFAEFAHWASDHRALITSVPSRPPSRLTPPKRLPKAHLEEAAHLLKFPSPQPG